MAYNPAPKTYRAQRRAVTKSERIMNDLLGGKLPAAAGKSSRRRVKPLPVYPSPKLIGHVPQSRISPYAGIQIDVLRDLYGARQLPAALSGYSLGAMNDLLRKLPGARPA